MGEGSNQFRTTCWSTVLGAAQQEALGHDSALAKLCEDYYSPLFEFARYWLKSPEDAADLTQGFFCHFIERNVPAAAGRERGRFRTFLLACFKNYIRDEWRRSRRARQVPDEMITSLSFESDTTGRRKVEPSEVPFPGGQADRLWASSIQQRVVQRLKEEYSNRGKRTLFLKLSPLLDGKEPANTYAEMAANLGISKEALKMDVMRLRERFRNGFRGEVAETVSSPEDIDPESRYLLSLLFAP